MCHLAGTGIAGNQRRGSSELGFRTLSPVHMLLVYLDGARECAHVGSDLRRGGAILLKLIPWRGHNEAVSESAKNWRWNQLLSQGEG